MKIQKIRGSNHFTSEQQTTMTATKKANVIFNGVIKSNMDKVLQHEVKELTIKLEAILEGLVFRFFSYAEGDGVSYRRQITTPEGVRADSPYVAEFIKELNSLTRHHVQDHLNKTGDKITSEKYRTCFTCQKQSDACKVCSGCKSIRYCSTECQSKDWKEHKKVCGK